MAAIVPTVTDVSAKADGSALLYVWSPVTSAGSDTCVAAMLPDHVDKSIHVSGTFGGASVAVNGSNNGGASYAALNDPFGNVIAIAAEKIKAVRENTVYTQPAATGGSGQTLKISMLFLLRNPLRT